MLDRFNGTGKKRRVGGSGVVESHTELWARLWSTAVIHLGLSSAEFYAMTPRQFGYMCERLDEKRRFDELLHGILTSCIVNTSYCAPKKPRTPADFMPSEMRNKAPKPRKYTRRDVDQATADVRFFMEGLITKHGKNN